MSQNTDIIATPTTNLTVGERAFVEKIARYYHTNDGMPLDCGRVLGYLMISDPPQKGPTQICATLGVSREAADRMIQQLTPSGQNVDGVFQRLDVADSDDYVVWMVAGRWAAQIKKVFAGIPDFHHIIQRGLVMLADAPAERRQRLANMERLLGYLSTEIPAMWARYKQSRDDDRNS